MAFPVAEDREEILAAGRHGHVFEAAARSLGIDAPRQECRDAVNVRSSACDQACAEVVKKTITRGMRRPLRIECNRGKTSLGFDESYGVEKVVLFVFALRVAAVQVRRHVKYNRVPRGGCVRQLFGVRQDDAKAVLVARRTPERLEPRSVGTKHRG